jgi:uroporphyrinogen decarboxylase
MQPLTGVERIGNILKRKPVDRIGVYEHFWGDTYKAWQDGGFIKPGESYEDHFNYDLQELWAFNLVADLDFKPVTVEETEETILQRDGNGALLRRHKLHDTTPEHVDFLVKDRSGWEEHVKPHLTADRRRINFEGYIARQRRRLPPEDDSLSGRASMCLS